MSPGRRLGLVAVQYLLHQLLHREARAAVPIAASPLDPMNCRGREETQSSAHQPSLPALPRLCTTSLTLPQSQTPYQNHFVQKKSTTRKRVFLFGLPSDLGWEHGKFKNRFWPVKGDCSADVGGKTQSINLPHLTSAEVKALAL